MRDGDPLVGAAMDGDTLDTIATWLDGREWDADTLDRIADRIRQTGRPIRDRDAADPEGATPTTWPGTLDGDVPRGAS